MAGSMRMIFQLGTNNWQKGGEFAPGSGILHQAHHEAYNRMPNTKCFSVYPSKTQRFIEDDFRVFPLEHDIPICESVSPVSSYRWHTMSDEDFKAYRQRLIDFVMEFMDDVEKREGKEFTMAIAHHTFLNPVVMRDVIRKRVERGQRKIPLIVFVHGTALKMFRHEKGQQNPTEFPQRFLPFMKAEKVFAEDVDVCFAISKAEVGVLADVYPEFPSDRVVVSPNGVNPLVFHPIEGATKDTVLPTLSTKPYEGSSQKAQQLPTDADKVVLFIGKFADWKRLDSMIFAAKLYEEKGLESGIGKIVTLIAGTGPVEAQKEYQELAIREGLKNLFFLGPLPQPMLAKLATISDIGVFPSLNEPFGMVFIECMSCGTPVIGADSGGPRDFVSEDVGRLVPESSDNRVLGESLSSAVLEALKNDWKHTGKGAAGMKLAADRYSVSVQCDNLLRAADQLIQTLQ